MQQERLASQDALTHETIIASGLSYEEYQRQFMGDERRTEWITGDVILLMNNVLHNEILSFLDTLLRLYLGFKPIGKVLLAGISMYVGDDKPAREPDLMIVLNEHRDRIQETRLNGAADIAIEIVSPESRARDAIIKYDEYQAIGVREYWLIDPERQQADIYVLDATGRYRRAALDGQGRLVSSLLAGFTLDPAILWRESLPEGADLIQLVQEWVNHF